jgi:signal recognition particle receptor subunit beta
MKFQGSVIKEQGVTFAIVIVKSDVLNNKVQADQIIAAFQAQVFPGIPVVLMAQDLRGTPAYYGRQDISKFLASVPLANIPWKEYTLA